MWRSNVLRLRHCSSTAATRNGLNTGWHSSDSSLPVTEKEFQRALGRILTWGWTAESQTPLGFAISGGVDSMALAYLYFRARKEHESLPKAHGFIVDHKARPESTEEALWVAEELRSKYDMAASILTVTWPNEHEAHNSNAFETHARTLRYRALGRACRTHNITSLMVAHHGDDQAETIMMRLANNRLRTGLKGMQSVEWIPECEGIYGVHQSGKSQNPHAFPDIPFLVEQGGVRILRPLLALEKSRLVATCTANGVQWAEDKTNQEPTLTSRNAIRHIYKNHKLPEALSIQSLVETSLRMQKRVESHRSYADRLFNDCLLKLDIQTGTLLVRFPPFESLLSRPIETESDKNEAKDNAYCLIERVAELVTSKFKPALGQLASRIDNIYPEFMTPEEEKEVELLDSYSMTSFTVYHVWWRRWDKASPFEEDGLPSEDFSSTAPHPKEWLLTRQTLEQEEVKKLEIVVAPSQASNLNSNPSGPGVPYHLFDGRFWIKLENFTHDSLIIRHFEKTDMRHLPTTQKSKTAVKDISGPIPERFITAAFALLKPSDIRFTLPAVFRKESSTRIETLIGFPTLNVRMNGCGSPPLDICKWTVRYKKIDFGKRTAKDIIVPGLKIRDIIAQEKRMRLANKGITKLRVRHSRVAGGPAADRFTGYKRVSEQGKRERNWTYTQRAMQGEELDGLSFLVDEGQELEEETNKGKGRKEIARRTFKKANSE